MSKVFDSNKVKQVFGDEAIILPNLSEEECIVDAQLKYESKNSYISKESFINFISGLDFSEIESCEIRFITGYKIKEHDGEKYVRTTGYKIDIVGGVLNG